MSAGNDDSPGTVSLPRYAFDQLLANQREMAQNLERVAGQAERISDLALTQRACDERLRNLEQANGRLSESFERHDQECRENRSLQKADRPAWARMWIGILVSGLLGLLGLLAGLGHGPAPKGH